MSVEHMAELIIAAAWDAPRLAHVVAALMLVAGLGCAWADTVRQIRGQR